MDNHIKQMFEKLCKVSPTSIEIVDIRNGDLICTNAWASDYLGYAEDEYRALSKNFFERVVHPEDRSMQLEAFQYLFDNPHVNFKDVSLRALKKDGHYLHILIRLTVLELGQDQKPKTALAMVSDIEEIVALREKVDVQVKKLEAISFKNSHDLRGPVATILGLIHLIEHDRFESAFSRQVFGLLKKTVIKLDNAIHDINKQTH